MILAPEKVASSRFVARVEWKRSSTDPFGPRLLLPWNKMSRHRINPVIRSTYIMWNFPLKYSPYLVIFYQRDEAPRNNFTTTRCHLSKPQFFTLP